jgi:hypothetical protein
MLRVNTSLIVDLPPVCLTMLLMIQGLSTLATPDAYRAAIEGSWPLPQETIGVETDAKKKEWVDALNALNSYSNVDETPEFNISCLYSLLRLNPGTRMM